MKKTVFFILMAAMAASMNMSAEETQQTAAPRFVSDFFSQSFENSFDPDYREVYIDFGTVIDIENEDEEEATIYYRSFDCGEPSEWYEYIFPICPNRQGHYEYEAYAQAPGKLPSDITAFSIDVSMVGTELLYRACVVDGINYHFIEETTEVYVCSDDDPHFPSDSYYTGDIVIPDEIDFGGEIYAVTGIDAYAFYNCRGLSSVKLPNTIESIGENAFYNCTSLTSIEIPESVTYVQDLAFEGCSRLTQVTCRAITPPRVGANGMYWPDDLYNQATLYVPAESLSAYQAHEEWGRFGHIVPFVGAGPGDVDSDGNIGINDVTTLIDQLLSSDEQPEWMDVNGDGVVGIADVTHIIDMILSGEI